MKLLYFKGDWNGKCHAIDGKIPDYAQVIDVEAEPELTKKYNIEDIPCFIITDDNGNELHRIQTLNMQKVEYWYRTHSGEFNGMSFVECANKCCRKKRN